MKIIGLTGGIASGKSTVSAYLQKKGASIIDADGIAHELLAPGKPLYEVYRNHFGEKILLPDGGLNRRVIGQRVFSDPGERQWIDATAHPLIQQEICRRVKRYQREKKSLIVLDVPLLFESGWDKMAEKVCLVYVEEKIQLARLMKRNGYGREEAAARIAAQMPLEEKKKRADCLIDNSGSLSSTLRQVDNLWKEWTHDGVS
ncbi:MAG: dephospho-CoA kinase [Selenomonas sp.]|uniref:dephospho-CoA kinase n=1 Tax=Selenomonas sp. TaxID=2053611 RepID=UPI0025DC285D|nr:dephospho-CoA kinase [Selenomonas sp.]MCR5438839.1 dephospho-CoA kinase [Selenomonas sp.]